MRVVPPSVVGAGPSLSRIKPGDEVAVLTRDGQVSTFRVLTVENEVLVAADHTRYEKRDIVRLERRELSKGKTIGLVASATAAVIVLYLAWAVGSFLGGWT